MELSTKQNQIITAPETKIVVNACAGSGKTTVLTERVRYLLDNFAIPKQMVVITFTNNAADEMRNRLNLTTKDVFIGTIHAYANYLLLSNGIDTSKYIKDEDFDALFGLIKVNPQCIKPVEWLLLDEAQDCNASQLQFLFDIITPENYFVVGDFRQSIYTFSGARPDLFLQLESLPEVKTYELNENYRNGSVILDFAKWILRTKANQVSKDYYYTDNSQCKSGIVGNKTEITYEPAELARLIKSKDTYKDWFVLTRSNTELDKILTLLRAEGIPCDTFKQADLTYAQLQKQIKSNTVKILTIHSAKGLEANNVIVLGAKFYDEEACRVSYVAATRAKDLLIWLKGTTPRKRKEQPQNKIINWE